MKKTVFGVNSKVGYLLIKKARNDPDGKVYLIDGGEEEGLCAKLLKDCSSFKQSEVESCLQGSDSGSIIDSPIDIVYLRGKFVGYVYKNPDAWGYKEFYAPEPKNESEGDSRLKNRKNKISKETSSDNPLIRWGGLVSAIILISLLNLGIFHQIFLNFVNRTFSPTVLEGCETLGFSGVTAIIFGLIATGLLYTQIANLDIPMFIAVESGVFVIGIILTDMIIVVGIQVVINVANLLMTVLPAIIMIWILVIVMKKFFKW